MKKIFTLTLLLATSAIYSAEAELNRAAARANATPFSALRDTHPTVARLGRTAFRDISDMDIPDNPYISKAEALDTLRLIERTCLTLATGTQEEQVLAKELDATLEHSKTALKTLIKIDKEDLAMHMLQAIKAALATGTEDERQLGASLEGTYTHGRKTFETLTSMDTEALLAKPEISILKDRLITFAMRIKQIEDAKKAANVGGINLEATPAGQGLLFSEIRALKKEFRQIKTQRNILLATVSLGVIAGGIWFIKNWLANKSATGTGAIA